VPPVPAMVLVVVLVLGLPVVSSFSSPSLAQP
jgi:hypothetical protein